MITFKEKLRNFLFRNNNPVFHSLINNKEKINTK